MNRDILVETDGGQYQTITEAVVRSAAAVRNEEITKMEPLYHAIDSDALDRLFTSPSTRAVTVRFEYAGLTIAVDSSGIVRVEGKNESTRLGSESS